MARLYQMLDHILEDRRITSNEVRVIRDYMAEDGQLDLEDVRFLVELLSNAREVCPEFDELFFPVLKTVLLADGRMDQSEHFYLLKMIYGDGEIRPSELRFLQELRDEAQEVSPEFDELVRTAQKAHPTAWSLDGDEPSGSSLAGSGW